MSWNNGAPAAMKAIGPATAPPMAAPTSEAPTTLSRFPGALAVACDNIMAFSASASEFPSTLSVAVGKR